MIQRTSKRDLLQLIYVSSVARELTSADLAEISALSRERNRTFGLTGLLLHRGDEFYGLLEGPENNLLARMEVIITDPRHRYLRALREEPIVTRRFANWSFAALPRSAAQRNDAATAQEFIKSLTVRGLWQ